MSLLASKLHQEFCEDIHAFVWRLCVSYRAFNSITVGFEFPILRCANSIEDLGDSCGTMHKIFLDVQNCCNQMFVRTSDQENFTFFTPSGSNKTYNVLPFGHTNAPNFKTSMMQALCKK